MPVFAPGGFQTMSQYLTEHAVTLLDRLSLFQSICVHAKHEDPILQLHSPWKTKTKFFHSNLLSKQYTQSEPAS
jgi:hypothetical protein